LLPTWGIDYRYNSKALGVSRNTNTPAQLMQYNHSHLKWAIIHPIAKEFPGKKIEK
jgi:hypothetical protein